MPKPLMDADELRDGLGRLGVTQPEAARMCVLDERSMRRWLADQADVPNSVAAFVRYLVHTEADPREVSRLARRPIPPIADTGEVDTTPR